MASLNNKNGVSADITDGRPMFTSPSKMIMNEKVQNLASVVYQEFEKMITNYDANVVKNLMPTVVDMLECLESAYMKTDELEIQIEMMAEDLEQLESEYQKEKKLRIGAAERHMELEDTIEATQEESNTRLHNLNSVIRSYEIKTNELEYHVSSVGDQEKYELNVERAGSDTDDTREEMDNLIATKHALTTVKDDLIRTVDRLMTENDDLRKENRGLHEKKVDLQQQIRQLVHELLKQPAKSFGPVKSSSAKHEADDVKTHVIPVISSPNELQPLEIDQIRDRVEGLETAVNVIVEDNNSPRHISRRMDEDDNFWDAEGNHFTWAEMERVLQERNQYKVQYMELQEAIRWTATMNAMKAESKSTRMTLFGPRPKQGKGTVDKKVSDKRHFRQNNNGIRRFFSKFT